MGFRVYNCYRNPNCNLAVFKDFLVQLMLSIRSFSLLVIMTGDFNAKSKEWGIPRIDKGGNLLAELMSELDMLVCNEGQAPTFTHRYNVCFSKVQR